MIGALAGCSSHKTAEREEAAGAVVPNVTVAKVSKSSIDDYYEATGTVKAKTVTNVSANIMGRIVAISVNEGDTVSKGQVVAEIDGREAQAQRQKAEAGLAEAQAALAELDRGAEGAEAAVRSAEASRQLADQTLSRIKELFDRKSASAQELDEAQARAKAAASELDRAKAGLQAIAAKRKQINARADQARADITSSKVYEDYSKIISPVSGVVVKKFSEQGATATPGSPLLSIEDNSSFKLEVGVEESRGRSVRVGSRVTVRVDAVSREDVLATVSDIVPAADPSTRTYTVKITLPAMAGLRSGMFGSAKFPTGQREAIAVPSESVVQRGQLTGVFTVSSEGVARFRIVTTGKTSGGVVEILSGLTEGEEVAVEGASALNDGSKVR